MNANNIHNMSNQELRLPPEVLFKIFSESSSSADLCHRIGLVCQSWQTLSVDDTLWENIYKKDFNHLGQETLSKMKPDISWKKTYETCNLLIKAYLEATLMQLDPPTMQCRTKWRNPKDFDDNDSDMGIAY